MSFSLVSNGGGLYLGRVSIDNLPQTDISASPGQLVYAAGSNSYEGLNIGYGLYSDGSLNVGVAVSGGTYIPVLTANVDQGFTCSASSVYPDGLHEPFRPCDYGNLIDGWAANDTNFPITWSIQLPEAIVVSQFLIQRRANSERPTAFEFQGSNDGSNWDTLVTCGDIMPTNDPVLVPVETSTAYNNYRLYITAGFEFHPGMTQFQLYRKVIVAPPANVEFLHTVTTTGPTINPRVYTSILFNGSGTTATYNLPDGVDGQQKCIVSGINNGAYNGVGNNYSMITCSNNIGNDAIDMPVNRSVNLVWMTDLSGWVMTSWCDNLATPFD